MGGCNCSAVQDSLSPVHTSNNVEATLSKQQATLLPKQQATVASIMLSFWATISKQRSTLSEQHSTLSKGRNFNAKLVRHCCRYWQQSQTLLRHCCQNRQQYRSNLRLCRSNVRLVAFDNVAWTLLLVWTGLYDQQAYSRVGQTLGGAVSCKTEHVIVDWTLMDSAGGTWCVINFGIDVTCRFSYFANC